MPTSRDLHIQAADADAATKLILDLLKERHFAPAGSQSSEPAVAGGYRIDAGTARTVRRRVNAAVDAQHRAFSDAVQDHFREAAGGDDADGGLPLAEPRGTLGEVEDGLRAWEQARLACEREETRLMSLDSYFALMREQARRSAHVEELRRRVEAVPGFPLLEVASMVRFSEELSPAACVKFRAELARGGLTGREGRDVSIVDLQKLLGPDGVQPHSQGRRTTPLKRRPGRPKVVDKEPRRYEADLKLYRDYSSSGVSQREFLRRLGRDDDDGMKALDRGRKHQAKAAKGVAE